MSNCTLKFKYVIVKSLMIEDKRVGEEAKVDRGVLFIRHLRNRITIWIWYCLFGYSLNNRLRVNIPRCHASFKKKKWLLTKYNENVGVPVLSVYHDMPDNIAFLFLFGFLSV